MKVARNLGRFANFFLPFSTKLRVCRDSGKNNYVMEACFSSSSEMRALGSRLLKVISRGHVYREASVPMHLPITPLSASPGWLSLKRPWLQRFRF